MLFSARSSGGWFVILLVAGLCVGALFFLLPIWAMVSLSLGESLSLWPVFPRWAAYQRLIELLPLWQLTANSLIIALVGTILHLVVCIITAYGLSRGPQRPAAWVTSMVIITMLVPVQVNIIPLFFLMKTLHWMNTVWALVVPGAFGAFGMLFLTEWLNSVQHALDEAACLDGCRPWQTLCYILLPICRPALITLGLLAFITSWNSFIWPLLVTHGDAVKTLPVAIASLKSSYREAVDWPVLMAATTLSTLPLLALFMVSHRYLMSGMTAGSIKE